MRRREFVQLAAAATVAIPQAVRAQQKLMPVIGFLSVAQPGPGAPYIAAFLQGLKEAGWVPGQNVAIEYRWAEDHNDRLPALAADLVGRNVDVILTRGGLPPAVAAKSATSTIPIVFVGIDTPVESGLAASFARPGGNVTGIRMLTGELMPKRFELLSELVPHARVIALLVNPNNPTQAHVIPDMAAAARAKGLQFPNLRASTEGEFEAAFASLSQLHVDALLVGNDPFFFSRLDQLVALAARHAVPAMYEWREFVAAGGLASYGTSLAGIYQLAGAYVGRILKGEKPADLPIQQPTKFELAINLKTARALGLTVPQSILARADEVME